jgi:hypothetical protein
MKRNTSFLFAVLFVVGCTNKTYVTINESPAATPVDAGRDPVAAVSPDAGSTIVSDMAPAVASDTGTAPMIVPDSGTAMDADPIVDTGKTVVVSDGGSTSDVTPVSVSDAQASEAGTTPPSCKLAWSGKIADGVGGEAAVTKNGFGVIWYDQESMGGVVNFRSFDWKGTPIADAVTLINLNGFVGGEDSYAGLFWNDGGMERDWSVYKIGADGKLDPGTYFVSDEEGDNGHVPSLSFDGTYYRGTSIAVGPSMCESQAEVFTGRFSSSSVFLTDNSTPCMPVSYTGLSVVSIADDGSGKPVMILDSWENQGSLETMYLIDYKTLVVGAIFPGDNTRRAIQAFYSKEAGYLLSWYETGNGNTYFLSPLTQDLNIVSGYKMPAGFIPQVVTGSEVVSVVLDQLSGSRNFVKIALGGDETARVALAPPKSNCSQSVVGYGNTYVVLDGGCFGNNNQSVVEAAVVTCN